MLENDGDCPWHPGGDRTGALAAPPAVLARDLPIYTLAVQIYADVWATTGVLIDHV